MRLVHLLLRGVGWLLTPLVAWAASFSGAWLGTLAGSLAPSADLALVLTLVAGAGGAVAGTLLWMRLLRRSPRLRHALAVTEEGVPEAAVAAGDTKEEAP